METRIGISECIAQSIYWFVFYLSSDGSFGVPYLLLTCVFQNFYKNEINRKEMYLRYIHRLHDLHLSAENFLEAGFTMKLYADQLSWSQRVLPVGFL